MDRVGDLINVLKKKDEHVAIVNQSNEEQKAYTKAQLPAELEDFKDEWASFDCRNKLFLSKIPAGKTRTFKGSMLIASMWETKKLIHKTELSVEKIGFSIQYKVLQYVNTKHNPHIMCCPNSMYLPAVTKQLRAVLKEAATWSRRKSVVVAHCN